jgi:hypothetical protein
MKKHILLYFLILITSNVKVTAQTIPAKETFDISIVQLPDNSVTTAIKEMSEKTTLTINRDNHKITATAYYSLFACGDYSASPEIKNDSVVITINNSIICDGDNKYFKLEAVIDNPKDILYRVTIDEAFTFLKKGERIQQFRDEYLIGDIDGDKINNKVTIEYDKVIEANDSISNDCGRGICYMTAKFGKGIPDITQSMCYGMSIESLPDLNGDGRIEIIMGTHYFIGNWHNVLIWSFNGKQWVLLNETKVYGVEGNDAALVVKEKNGYYYLKYETWDDELFDIISAKKKIKIK